MTSLQATATPQTKDIKNDTVALIPLDIERRTEEINAWFKRDSVQAALKAIATNNSNTQTYITPEQLKAAGFPDHPKIPSWVKCIRVGFPGQDGALEKHGCNQWTGKIEGQPTMNHYGKNRKKLNSRGRPLLENRTILTKSGIIHRPQALADVKAAVVAVFDGNPDNLLIESVTRSV